MRLTRRSFLRFSALALAALARPAATAHGQSGPSTVRGLYFPGEKLVNSSALAEFQSTVLRSGANAVVVDIKNEGGIVHLEFEHPLKPDRQPRYAYPDHLLRMLAWCRENGIRPIARQVVFQDGWLASHHPDHALLDFGGNLWRDADGQGRAYADPFSEGVHDYNAAIAEAAARLGFAEVQFDYLRFPTGQVHRIAFRRAWTFENRTTAVAQFLAAAAPRVRAQGATVSADVFGVTAWKEQKDAGIGQSLEAMAPHLDALCPMAYPSTYGTGIPDCPDKCKPATAHAREIVYFTTIRARERVQRLAPHVRVIPWIQTFADYRFFSPFGRTEYWEQQRGAYAAGAAGVHCWGPTGQFATDVFLPDPSRSLLLARVR